MDETTKELKSIKASLENQNELLKNLTSAIKEGLDGIKKEISDLA